MKYAGSGSASPSTPQAQGSEARKSSIDSFQSSVWLTSKMLERSLRGASQWIAESVSKREEQDEEIAASLKEFEEMKQGTETFSKLFKEYRLQQDKLKETEAALAHELNHLGSHLPPSPLSASLSLAGDLLSKSSRHRQGLTKAAETVSNSVDTLLNTAVADLQVTMEKYDSARRAYHAAVVTKSHSRSGNKDESRSAQLQSEVDSTYRQYQKLYGQVASKVTILAYHRTRELCSSVSGLMDQAKVYHKNQAELLGGWTSWVPDEQQAIDVIEKIHQKQENETHPTVASAPTPRALSPGGDIPQAIDRNQRVDSQTWSEVELDGQGVDLQAEQTPETLYSRRGDPELNLNLPGQSPYQMPVTINAAQPALNPRTKPLPPLPQQSLYSTASGTASGTSLTPKEENVAPDTAPSQSLGGMPPLRPVTGSTTEDAQPSNQEISGNLPVEMVQGPQTSEAPDDNHEDEQPIKQEVDGDPLMETVEDVQLGEVPRDEQVGAQEVEKIEPEDSPEPQRNAENTKDVDKQLGGSPTNDT